MIQKQPYMDIKRQIQTQTDKNKDNIKMYIDIIWTQNRQISRHFPLYNAKFPASRVPFYSKIRKSPSRIIFKLERRIGTACQKTP